MSNIFNQYFISVGKKLAENSNFDFNKFASNTCESWSSDNLFCKIEAEDVINLVNSKDDTAPGYEE